MDQVMAVFRRVKVEKEIPGLRLEIDYELATLHDAMLVEDLEAMNKSKQHLKQLSEQFYQLNNDTQRILKR